jgi:protoporphyrinogen oxidase
MPKHYVIVGAGLAGLSAALELENLGANVTIIEKDSKIGGRIQTDKEDGYLFDRGFQVLLPSYELIKKLSPVKELSPHFFRAGAVVHKSGESLTLADPLQEPTQILSAIMNPLFNFKEKAITAKLRQETSSFSYEDWKKKSLGSSKSWLLSQGYSQSAIDNFFQPFFSGVFLDSTLNIEASFFLYLFGKFGSAKVCLPHDGMGALPENLKNKLKNTKILLKTEFLQVRGKSIVVKDKNGESEIFADGLLIAQDPWSLGAKSSRRVITIYFTSDDSPNLGAWLHLNANEHRKMVNHVASLAEVNPNYAPKGKHLISVNCLLKENQELSMNIVREELVDLFGKKVEMWQHKKTYDVKFALPILGDTFAPKLDTHLPHAFAGDYLESPSIQGALFSGCSAAQKLSQTDLK